MIGGPSEAGGSVHPTAVVHATAVVDRGAAIGAETSVWHFCHVMAGAQIGRRCVLGQNVFVGGAARVGDGCKVQNNVSLYDGVHLEDDVFVGPSAVFTNVIAPRAFISQRAAFRPTVVGRGATVGANATVICGRRLGAYSFVAAGAVVTRDVPPHAQVAGVPARWQAWVCRCGGRLVAAEIIDQLRCPGCAARFRLEAPPAVGSLAAPVGAHDLNDADDGADHGDAGGAALPRRTRPLRAPGRIVPLPE